jgi:hypothetical protein
MCLLNSFEPLEQEVELESEAPLPKEIASQVVAMMKSKKAIGAKQSSAIKILKWSADRAEKVCIEISSR